MASVLTLDDAKAHLNISASDTTQDTELQRTIDAAEAVITRRLGVLSATQFTARLDGDSTREVLALPKTPVVSLTSVTPVGGNALTLTDLYLDPDAGLIEWANGGYFTARRYEVIYLAGYTTIPNDLMQAIRELTRHLWESQRARLRSRGAETDMNAPGYLIPYRVEALLQQFESLGLA